MSAEFDQVAKLLLKLDVGELAEVRARAGILTQAGGASAPTSSAAKPRRIGEQSEEDDVDLVLGQIAAHMYSEGIEYASLAMLKRTTNYKSFAEKVPASMEFFRKITRNRTKLRALITMSIRFLYKDMAKIGTGSTSTRTMMNHWHRVPAVLNSNFPGYAKAGLLGLILRDGAAEAVERYVQDSKERESYD